MKLFFKSIIDLILYSSLHISIAAALLTLESFYLLGIDPYFYYISFVFFSTMLIYSLHRIIGIKLVKDQNLTERFRLIVKFRHHLILYALLASAALIYILFHIDFNYIKPLIPAGLISLLYVIPLFKKKRIRDVHFIKIFLIAIVWMYVSATVPTMASAGEWDTSAILISLEKLLFIFAITLPFDVRDLKVDNLAEVDTLAKLLGINKSYLLSYLSLLLGCIILLLAIYITELDPIHFMSIIVAYGLAIGLVGLSKNKSSDYYYSGLLDGSIILRSLIIILSFII